MLAAVCVRRKNTLVKLCASAAPAHVRSLWDGIDLHASAKRKTDDAEAHRARARQGDGHRLGIWVVLQDEKRTQRSSLPSW